MRIQLPMETWIEILDWLKRRDLVKKLDKLWDRQFTSIVQDWLHKYTRNVRIRTLWARRGGLLSLISSGQWEKVPFADVDLPGNITGFERVDIGYLDSTVMAFLRRMRPVLHNIFFVVDCVYQKESLYRIETALHFLIPVIGGSIETLILNYQLLEFFSTNHPSALINAKLLQIRRSFVSNEIVNILIDWLFATKRDDGHARMLIHWCWDYGMIYDGIYEKIRERFLDSARQSLCPFFVRIAYANHYQLPKNMLLLNAENVRTGEQLTFKAVKYNNRHYVLITNFPKNTNVEWLDKKTEELLEWDEHNNNEKQQVISLAGLEINSRFISNSKQMEAKRNFLCKWKISKEQQAICLDSPKLGPLDSIDDPQQQPSTGSMSTEANIAQEKPGTSNAQNLEEEEEPGKKRSRLI